MAREIFQFQDINRFLKKYVGEENIKLAEIYQKGFPVVESFVLGRNSFLEFSNKEEEFLEKIEIELKSVIENMNNKNFISFMKGEFFISLNTEKLFENKISFKTLGLSQINFEKFSNTFENKIDAYKIYLKHLCDYYILLGNIDENIFKKIKTNLKKTYYGNLTIDFYKKLSQEYMKLAKDYFDLEIEENPLKQIIVVMKAIYEKWYLYEEIKYRKKNLLDQEAFYINFQEAVFSEKNSISFSGEITSVEDDSFFKGIYKDKSFVEMKQEFPGIYNQIQTIMKKLKVYFKTLFTLKYTVEDGIIFFYDYQESSESKTIENLYKIYSEGLISKTEFIDQIDAKDFVKNYVPEFINGDLENMVSGEAVVGDIRKAYFAFDAATALELENKGKEYILYLEDLQKEKMYTLDKAKALIINRKNLDLNKKKILKNLQKGLISIDVESNIEKKEIKIGNKTIKNEERISFDSFRGKIYKGFLEERYKQPADYIREINSWMIMPELRINPSFNFDYMREYKNDILYSESFYSLDYILQDDYIKDEIFSILLEKKEESIEKIIEKLEFKISKMFESNDGKEIFLDLGKRSVYEFLPRKKEIEKKLQIELKKHNIKTVNNLKKIINNIENIDQNYYIENKGINQLNENIIYELIIRIVFSTLKKRTDLKIKLNIIISELNNEKDFEYYIDQIQNIAYEEAYNITDNVKFGVNINRLSFNYWNNFKKMDFVFYDLKNINESLSGISKKFYDLKKQFDLNGMNFYKYNKDIFINFLKNSVEITDNLNKYIIIENELDADLIKLLKKLKFKAIFTDVINMTKLRVEVLKKGEKNEL